MENDMNPNFSGSPIKQASQRIADERELLARIQEFVRINVNNETTTLAKFDAIVEQTFSAINGTFEDWHEPENWEGEEWYEDPRRQVQIKETPNIRDRPQ